MLRFACRSLAAVLLCTSAARAGAPPPTLDLEALKGRVVLVDFWASWCGPCKESFPWMQQIQNRYGDQGVVVVGVNLDRDRALAEAFLDRLRPRFPIVFDPQAKFAESFKVAGMPASFYIDRAGRVRFQHIGFHAEESARYERELAQLVAER